MDITVSPDESSSQISDKIKDILFGQSIEKIGQVDLMSLQSSIIPWKLEDSSLNLLLKNLKKRPKNNK